MRDVDTGAADVVAGYAVWPRSVPVDDAREPRIAFVVESEGPNGRGWPVAALLAVMDAVAGNPPEKGVCFFIIDRGAMPETGAGGTSYPRRRNLREYLTDAGVGAVVLLDINGPPVHIEMKYSSLGLQSPLHLVEISRKAAALSLGAYGDDGIGQLLSVAGLDAGSEILRPWLASGIPAIALESKGGSIADATERDLAGFALRLAVMVPDGDLHGFDRDYLRYPLPGGVITFDDTTIVVLFIAVCIVLGVAASLGMLGDRKKTVSPIGLFREVLTALALSLLSFWTVATLVKLVMGAVSGSLLDGLLLAGKDFPAWVASFSLALRLGAFLSAYFAFSGLASRFDLLGRHGRLEAAMAATALLCLEAMAAMALIPPVVPFFLMAILLVAFTAQSAVASGLGLVVVVSVLLPYILRVLFSSAGKTGAVVTILEAGLGGISVMASLAAPFILWTVAASSPAASLHRGRRTAAAWAVSAILFSLGEAAVRTAIQFK